MQPFPCWTFRQFCILIILSMFGEDWWILERMLEKFIFWKWFICIWCAWFDMIFMFWCDVHGIWCVELHWYEFECARSWYLMFQCGIWCSWYYNDSQILIFCMFPSTCRWDAISLNLEFNHLDSVQKISKYIYRNFNYKSTCCVFCLLKL